MTVPEDLFCPLHGDYLQEEESSRCPHCAADPVASSASLRQVRVVREDELDPDPVGMETDQLTPMVDEFPCPVCGQVTAADKFRVESVGEVWTGNAAVWAEEGVCPDCYADVLSPQIRDWSDAEWLAHHFEGWKATVGTVHNLFVYEESLQESWLPEAQRHKVLDVEATLSARREHLARCQMSMRDLKGRYRADLTPPPFQMTMAMASEAVSPKAAGELQAMRERDVNTELLRRHDSVVARSPWTDSGEAPMFETRSHPAQGLPKPAMVDRWGMPMVTFAVIVALAALAAWFVSQGAPV
ncbi:MAG: hypothetical protein GY898_12775 [Proteobacteria bacterium]|nr:hypothetical protein [Pseudomonadota bacterium]